jgi:hypothetical protein
MQMSLDQLEHVDRPVLANGLHRRNARQGSRSNNAAANRSPAPGRARSAAALIAAHGTAPSLSFRARIRASWAVASFGNRAFNRGTASIRTTGSGWRRTSSMRSTQSTAARAMRADFLAATSLGSSSVTIGIGPSGPIRLIFLSPSHISEECHGGLKRAAIGSGALTVFQSDFGLS